jgi:type IV pilus assembly protein PilY1
MNRFLHCAFDRACALVALAIASSIMLQPPAAFAATIAPTLTESPLQGQNPVKPNIMYTMDDSGSMGWDFLPDYTAFVTSSIYHCRDGQCGGATSAPGTGYTISQYDPSIRSSAYNGLYYDPTTTYNAGKKSDGTSLPFEKTSPGTWTNVYSNSYKGYPSAPTSGTINLAPTSGTPTAALNTTSGSFPDTIWCMKSTASTTDYATADTDGSVCRRNGRAYSRVTVGATTTPAITAGYNYPNNTNPPVTCVGSDKCKFTNRYTVYGYPYYYTISQVQYCSAKDTNGWGTSPCVSLWDQTTYKYVRYGTGALTFDPQAFTRVDIKPSGFLVNGVPAANPSGRTYAAEMDNFAKWYAFYRTRVQANQGAAGIAFSALDQNSRVGFHTLWENSTLFTNIGDFTTANKQTWFTKLYAVAPNNGTPLPDAVWRIGELFSGNTAATGLPGATDPLSPVTGKCQPNYHLLSTDGYWNSTLSYASRGNDDKTVPTALSNLPGQTGLTPGAQFPRPYYEGPTATTNSLADLAMYYWIHDLRPTVPDQVKDSIAPWQHVTLYGLAIGAHGNVPYPNGINSITSGTLDWPPATGAGGPEAIDDLWHAAVNSRGKYFNAKNAQQLAESVVSSLADFTDAAGTGTGVGLAGAQLSTTNEYAYKASYESALWGDVKKYTLDIITGVLPVDANGNPLSPPIWSAATQLETQTAGTGWDTNRRIVTRNDASNTTVPFRLASLSPAQQSGLTAGWNSVSPQPTAQSVLNYIRGDRSNEGVDTTSFRPRSHILGDIVYSGAIPVGPPNLPYTDGSNPGYEEFKSTYAARASTVYVGANDGMLHAFDDTVANGGKETWAYIPLALYNGGDPNDSAHTPSAAFQLGALTYRRGGIPLFSHKFYVNTTPRIWDVDFANTNVSNVSGPPKTGNDWRTLLTGGLGAGGRAIYALDITNPVKLTDTEAAVASSGRVLWEFTENNLGYVFDQPTLVKTYRYGWVALVVSGFNNPGGKGYVYVLNPKNGAILKKLALPNDTGTDVSPTGLSTIRAYVLSRKDPYVLQAYGGDLKGNVWRFDLSNPDDSKWKTELIAHLADPNGKAQPITTGVRIEIDQNNGVDRYIFVGTGKLLDQPDLPDTSVINSVYVIKDGTRTTPEPAPATPYSRTNLNAVNGGSIAGFATAPTGRGWYQDATSPDQKIVTDVYADVQVVVYAFSYPSSDPCLGILAATLFARDLTTGNSVLENAAGGAGGSVVASVNLSGGLAGAGLIQAEVTTAVPAPPVQVQVTTLTGQVYSFGVHLSSAAGTRHRVSWRWLN